MQSAMPPSEIQGMCFMNAGNPSIFPIPHIPATVHTTLPPPLHQSYEFPTNFPNQTLEVTPNSCISNNSTSDEADDVNQAIRRQRRMISNRESARRSRMRKKKRLDELWSQAVLLRTENSNLVEKMNDLSESHRRVVQENVRLNEENCGLRLMVNRLQESSNSCAIFDDLGEITCDIDHLRA